jgi:hypothetical protein
MDVTRYLSLIQALDVLTKDMAQRLAQDHKSAPENPAVLHRINDVELLRERIRLLRRAARDASLLDDVNAERLQAYFNDKLRWTPEVTLEQAHQDDISESLRRVGERLDGIEKGFQIVGKWPPDGIGRGG